PDQRLIRENLQRVERLAVLLGHAPRVTTVQAHDDLLLVLLGAHIELEARVVDHFFAPLAHRFRGFGLRPLLRHLDGGEVLEVAGAEIVFAALATGAARAIVAAIPAAGTAATATTSAGTAAAALARDRGRGRGNGRRRRGRRLRRRGALVHVGFDDDPLHAAE